jgi:talin
MHVCTCISIDISSFVVLICLFPPLQPRQNLLNAASKIGEAGHDIMVKVEDETEADAAFQDSLLALAKAVANTTAALVLKAKGVAGQCDNQGDQNAVIGSATQCALATSQLVACTKVVAPTIQNPSCQEQLVEAAKHVAKNVDAVADTAQVGSLIAFILC